MVGSYESVYGLTSALRGWCAGTPGDALPEGLMKKLKGGLGSHIKRNHFTYLKAIGKEVTNINRVLHFQSIGMDVLNSLIMASFVGLFNYFTM